MCRFKYIKLKFIKATYIYCKGLFRVSRHNFDVAIINFNSCLDISGDSKFLHYNCYKYLGIAHYYKKDYERSKNYLEEANNAIEENQKDAELITFLGFIQEVEGNYKSAIEQYNKAKGMLKRGEIFTNLSLLEERLKICNNTISNN